MRLREERNYEFRKRLLTVHKQGIRDKNRIPSEDEFLFLDGCTVYLPENSDEVIMTAAKDFVEYLFTSMEVSAMLKKKSCSPKTEEREGCVIIHTPASSPEILEDANAYMGYRIIIANDIHIWSHDVRGAAQALYHLEDLMSSAHAPVLPKKEIRRKAAFSPRMIHSGYGKALFPEQHLAAIAHAGMDAIMISVQGVDSTSSGRRDFNELIYRAKKYGIDVYAYIEFKNDMHPQDPGAEEYYDGLYGKIFQNCPEFKGVILVGESVEFPSRDPKVSKPGFPAEGELPSEKPRPGWWPCEDYGEWLQLVQKTIYKYNPSADIVFWTYNWGWAPKEERLKLLEMLPNDISLMVTYETDELFCVEDTISMVSDYTISFAGPSEYFVSEAKKAKELGIRLYTQANSAGLTWDFAMIPYEPFPFQWLKRWRGMLEAKKDWGLRGVMESHDYGFWPSFISAFEKEVFFEQEESYEELLEQVLARFFGIDQVIVLKEILHYWSEAITYYLPIDEDQYGAFRIGPAYPLCLDRELRASAVPYSAGNQINFVGYTMESGMMVSNTDHKCSLIGVKLEPEIRSLLKMKELLEKGFDLLQKIENKNQELLYLENMGQFMICCAVTGIHAKRWYYLKSHLKIESEPARVAMLIQEMEELAQKEIENTLKAIPLVQKDSRLGWEPCQDYMADEERLRWKIRQVEFMLDKELGTYKKRLQLSLSNVKEELLNGSREEK